MREQSFLGQSILGFHRVAYTEWGENTDKPPIICVHGLTRNGRDFDWLAKALQDERRVLCPDIVGRGQSDHLADPSLYGYPQYLSDMTALIARSGAAEVDWVGTSMGGLIGMLLAAQPNSPIRRLVINDVGPFLSLSALQRIATYAGQDVFFDDFAALEAHMRKIYIPFGIRNDADWQRLAKTSVVILPDGRLTLNYDTAIAANFKALKADVDLWPFYDKIRCPTLVLRGAQSDILTDAVTTDMTKRGPKAERIDFENVGHAPALIDIDQITAIKNFLRI
jgi:hypothetical protein